MPKRDRARCSCRFGSWADGKPIAGENKGASVCEAERHGSGRCRDLSRVRHELGSQRELIAERTGAAAKSVAERAAQCERGEVSRWDRRMTQEGCKLIVRVLYRRM